MTFLALCLSGGSLSASVWSASGLVASAAVACEDTPRAWWDACESAVAALDADLVAVEALGCAADAETFVLLSREGEPLSVVPPTGAAVPADHAATGVVPDETSLPARLASCDLSRAGWVANARDFLASLLTGRLASDPTVASATGFFTTGGELHAAAAHGAGVDPAWLPAQRGSTEVLGDLLLPAARRLGLRSRIPVVTGATVQACAVEGAGALPVAPLLTWGSPPLLSVPVTPPAAVVPGVALRAGGRSYQVHETRDLALLPVLAPDAKWVYAGGSAPLPRSLAADLGVPVVHRRSVALHAPLGLALLVATGAGEHLDRDALNPVTHVDDPFAALR